MILRRSRQERWNSSRPGRSPSRESSPQGTITWKFMDFGTADKKCQLSSKVLFHFHELCRLRLRKTRKGDLPGPGGGGGSCRGSARRSRRRSHLARGRGASGRRNKGLRGVRHHAGRAGGVIWPEGVVLPDEGKRVCGW